MPVQLRTADWDEMGPAILRCGPDYHGEVADRGLPYAADTGTLEALAAQGLLHVVVAEEAGRLVGFHVSVLSPLLNAKDTLHATVVFWYVVPGTRGQWVGMRLLRQAESTLRARGVTRMLAAITTKNDVSRMLGRCGFQPTELVFTKLLE